MMTPLKDIHALLDAAVRAGNAASDEKALAAATMAADRDGMGSKPVVFASDCPSCECCGEPWCVIHLEHYADCLCLGPDSE